MKESFCLLPHSPADRAYLLAENPELCSWAVVEALADRAVEEVAGAKRGRGLEAALDLAHLALEVAHQVTGRSGWRKKVTAYAQSGVACVLRAAGAAGSRLAVAAPVTPPPPAAASRLPPPPSPPDRPPPRAAPR